MAERPWQNGYNFTKTIHEDTYDFIKPEQFDLSGKAVFVTGASKGVGRAAAKSYAKAGASYIAIGARSDLSKTHEEILAAASDAGRKPPKILTIQIDVSSESSVQAAAAAVTEKFGRLDILVNNAGYLSSFVPLVETKVDDWWATYEVNVRGVYLTTRAFLPLMLKGGLKIILNMSSIGGNSTRGGASAYQSSKLAVQRFTEFINVDYGEQGMLAFSIHPGSLKTELATNMPEEMHAILTDTPELSGDAIVYYTAERREWLAGRFVSTGWDMKELLQKREKIIQEDLLKVKLQVGDER